MSVLNLLACQIDIPAMQTASERDAHVRRVASQVDNYLLQKPVDLVVLPELSTIDYSRDAFSRLSVLAEPAKGASFKVWRDIARKHQCHIVFGYAEALRSGYTIATAVIDAKGALVAVYHKLHLAQFGDSMEKEYFNSGNQNLVITEVNGFRVAPIICYDIRAPELCRTLAVDHNTDFILHTGAYARDPSFYSWHAFAITRAVENQVFFLSLNRAGAHFGSSLFCPPWVDEKNEPELFSEQSEQFRFITVKRKDLNQARADYTFLQDRLPGYQLPVIG